MSKLSLYSNASDLRKQQQSLYNNNFTDCSFAFEFIAMNSSSTYAVAPEFERVVNNVGFADVDSVGILNVPASNFSRLFFIKTNDYERIQANPGVSDTNTSYGLLGTGGVNPFMNFSYSYAQIRSGYANPALQFADNTLLYQDYVRYTAKSITGGYALSDIFNNEQELLTGVAKMDPLFNNNFSVMLNNMSRAENVSADIKSGPSYNYLISCKTLVDNLLSDATNINTTNASSYIRGQQFLRDLQVQSDAQAAAIFQSGSNVSEGVNFSGFDTNKYWVIFHPGDVMAIRLNYIPKNGNASIATSADGSFLGSNLIYNRSYKIYLKMT